jgi:dihydrofolate reductase
MSRLVRYGVAVSLDGFIAGLEGEYDWIVMDPAIDFAALYKQFDTALMGRKTYAMMTAQGGTGAMPGLDVVVFSTTLPPAVHKGVRITNEDPATVVASLKKQTGRDIWLFGGGELFRTLLDARLVDSVEVAVMPVLLGAGIPLLPPGAAATLVLADQKTLPKSGIVALSYTVKGSRAKAAAVAIGYLGKTRPAGAKTKTSKVRAAKTARRKPAARPATKRRG